MRKDYNVLLALMGLEIGGAETHVVELARGLQKEGFNVIVASNGGVYQKELEENNIKHYDVPLHNKNPINVVKSYKLLKEIIQEEKIDLVHAHARIPAFICDKLYRRMKFPFVTTAHWVFNTKWGLKYITNWGQKTIAVSEDIKKYLIHNYGIDQNNIKVTINGIDTEKFSKDIETQDVRKEFELKEGCTRIVYISRLDASRAAVAFQLLEAIPEVAKEIDDLEVVIVGGGDVYNQIQQKAEAINKQLGRRVIILTGGRTDINKFVCLSDLFIGVSRAALEAMAAEKPVIIAGNEGYIGIFDEDKLATSIKSNFTCRGEKQSNTETLLKDILQVLTKTDLKRREEMGAFGKKVIEERYSVKKMVEDNIEIYLRVLK